MSGFTVSPGLPLLGLVGNMLGKQDGWKTHWMGADTSPSTHTHTHSRLLGNPHANAVQMVCVTSQLSSRKTASCASLLCSWLMYLIGLIRASAYSAHTQRLFYKGTEFAAWPSVFPYLRKLQALMSFSCFTRLLRFWQGQKFKIN